MVLAFLVLLYVPVGSSNAASRWVFRYTERHEQQKRWWTHFTPLHFLHRVELHWRCGEEHASGLHAICTLDCSWEHTPRRNSVWTTASLLETLWAISCSAVCTVKACSCLDTAISSSLWFFLCPIQSLKYFPQWFSLGSRQSLKDPSSG